MEQFSTPEQVLKAARYMAAQEIAAEPGVRCVLATTHQQRF
jgi:hypothetical protein